MIIVGLLTAVEVVVNIIWIIYDPPSTTYVYPDRDTKIRICAVRVSIVLLLLCIFLAVLVQVLSNISRLKDFVFVLLPGSRHVQVPSGDDLSNDTHWILHNLRHPNSEVSRGF